MNRKSYYFVMLIATFLFTKLYANSCLPDSGGYRFFYLDSVGVSQATQQGWFADEATVLRLSGLDSLAADKQNYWARWERRCQESVSEYRLNQGQYSGFSISFSEEKSLVAFGEYHGEEDNKWMLSNTNVPKAFWKSPSQGLLTFEPILSDSLEGILGNIKIHLNWQSRIIENRTIIADTSITKPEKLIMAIVRVRLDSIIASQGHPGLKDNLEEKLNGETRIWFTQNGAIRLVLHQQFGAKKRIWKVCIF